jgi:hypothetical protein
MEIGSLLASCFAQELGSPAANADPTVIANITIIRATTLNNTSTRFIMLFSSLSSSRPAEATII